MHRRLALSALTLALTSTAACGGDDGGGAADAGGTDASPDAAPPDPDASTNRGSASITGTVLGRTLTPQSVFYMIHPQANVPILILHEDADVFCQVEDSPALVGIIAFECAPPAVGTRPIGDIENIDCAAAIEEWMLIEGFAGQPNEVGSLAGQLTIDSIGATIAGSFDANFGVGDDLTGTFEAVVCP